MFRKQTFIRLACFFHFSSIIFCLIYWVWLITDIDWHYSVLEEQVKGPFIIPATCTVYLHEKQVWGCYMIH